MPIRIQRKRTKGWKMPYTAKYVGRPTIFGNPFEVNLQQDAQKAVEMYRLWLHRSSQAWIVKMVKQMLKGKDLACWCALDQPCHADVLLMIANEGEEILRSAQDDIAPGVCFLGYNMDERGGL